MKKVEGIAPNAEAALSQNAALCYRVSPKGKVQILLITSRETGRWVLPKGWPMAERSPGDCALTEAFEEAGVFGRLIDQCVGVYSYRKVLGPKLDVPCVVGVYPVAVLGLRDEYPERNQRRRKWFTPTDAAGKVAEPELAALLAAFDPDTICGTRPSPG